MAQKDDPIDMDDLLDPLISPTGNRRIIAMSNQSTTVTTTNKSQSRIEKRRSSTGINKSAAVVGYVFGLIQNNHVPIDEVADCLTPDELQGVHRFIAEEERKKAEERARWAARERKEQERQQQVAAFYEATPPQRPLTTAPAIQTESDLVDLPANYHIAKVECVVEGANYHYEQFEYITGLERRPTEGIDVIPSFV